jgi:biotin transporter BioY
VQPQTKDRIAKGLGYVLGFVTALLVLGWAAYKLWNFISLF